MLVNLLQSKLVKNAPEQQDTEKGLSPIITVLLRRSSYPLFAGVVVCVSDIVLVVVGGGGGGDSRGVFGTHMVVSASLGAVGFSTVLTQKHRLLIVRELAATTFLVVLVAHQTGKVG